MRGWIYVAAGGAPGRVHIGHAAADPAGRAPFAARTLHYDAVVDAPQETVRRVHARLAPLMSADGTVGCSPEFAIAAIHHALGGPPAGERIYAIDDAPPAPPRPAPSPLRRERGGGAHRRLAATMLALAVVCAAVLFGTVRDLPVRDDREPALAMSAAAPLPTTAGDDVPPAATESVQPGATLPVPPPTVSVLDCAALWSMLPRCAALPKTACDDSDARLPRAERERIAALHAEVPAFDAAAFANFCRAACRHGYRPAREDFVLTVCSARG